MRKRKKKIKVNIKKYVLPSIILIVFALICIGADASSFNDAANAIADTVSELGGSISDTWTERQNDEKNAQAKVVNRKT